MTLLMEYIEVELFKKIRNIRKAFSRDYGVWYDYRVHCYLTNWRWLGYLPVWCVLVVPLAVMMILEAILETLREPLYELMIDLQLWSVYSRREEWMRVRREILSKRYGQGGPVNTPSSDGTS